MSSWSKARDRSDNCAVRTSEMMTANIARKRNREGRQHQWVQAVRTFQEAHHMSVLSGPCGARRAALLDEMCLGTRQFVIVEEDVEFFVVEGDEAGDRRDLAHRVVVGPGDV